MLRRELLFWLIILILLAISIFLRKQSIVQAAKCSDGGARVQVVPAGLHLDAALRRRCGRPRLHDAGIFISFSFIPMRTFATSPAMALLPRAPINGSPVPWLTSLYHKVHRGPYGNPGYPGNCGGGLIKDLLRYFKPQRVLDPMAGSGTCADVCRELGIACVSRDIRNGWDATDPGAYAEIGLFDFVWAHPPYWRQKRYTDAPADLSNLGTLDAFLHLYDAFIKNCAGVLKPDGKLAILMGDYSDREAGFMPLVYHTQRLCFGAGLQQACTQIVRFQHGNSSSQKSYSSSFIPGLHDVCTIMKKVK